MSKVIKEDILAFLRKSPSQTFTAKKIRDIVAPGTETSTIVEILAGLVELGDVEATKSDNSPNTQYQCSAPPPPARRDVQVRGASHDISPTGVFKTNKSHAIRQVLIASGQFMSPKDIHTALDGRIDIASISALCCGMETNGYIKRKGGGRDSQFAATVVTQSMTVGQRVAPAAAVSSTPMATRRESIQDIPSTQSFEQLLSVVRVARESLLAAKQHADDALIEAAMRSNDPHVRQRALVAHQCRESLRALADASVADSA